MKYNKAFKKIAVALAAFCLIGLFTATFASLLPAPIASLLPTHLSELLPTPFAAPIPAHASGGNDGDNVQNSGLIFLDYTVYARNSSRVLFDVFSDDPITLEARFRIPESISFSGDITARTTGGGFTGGVNAVRINGAQNLVTATFDLVYNGTRSTTLMFNFSGRRSIGGGEETDFNDPRSITITECVPDSEGAEYIPPSGPSEPPRFAVDLSARFPVANAGQRYILEIPVKNVGKQAARDITVSIDPGADAEFPFEYDKYAFTARMTELTVNSVKNARFELRVLPTAKSGQHTISVSFSGRTVLGVGSMSESSENIIITINNTNTAPKLTLERISLAEVATGQAAPAVGAVIEAVDSATPRIDAVKPGSAFILTVHIANSGTLPAKDVALTLKGLKADGISTDNAPDIRYINQIDGGAGASQAFELICAEGMAGDRTELILTIAYADDAGQSYSGDSQVFLPLVQSQKVSYYSSFEFTDIDSPSGSLGEGRQFSISFNVANTGDVPMEDIKLTFSAGQEFISRSLNTRMLKPIAPGGIVPLSFDFTVSNNIQSGNVPISFTLEYTPGDNDDGPGGGDGAGGSSGGQTAQRITATQYVGIQLFKPEETTTPTTTTTTEGRESVPKIIISNYDYQPREAKAGQTVDITLTFYNTSMSQEVKNIKILLDSDVESSGSSYSSGGSSGVFTPVEGSNSFYIEQIGPREEVERSIKLMIKADADAKSYQLFSNIEYEDSKSVAITTRESISIPVTQVTKVTIQDIMISNPNVMQGQPFNVSYTFINMGKTMLYNVMASIDGPFAAQAQGYYFGNLQPGSQEFYDANVIPDFPGDQIGFALITYEDAQGNLCEERMEFPFLAMEMMDMGDWMMDGRDPGFPGMYDDMPYFEEEPEFDVMQYIRRALDYVRQNPMYAAAGGAALLIIIIVVAALVRRAKNKRLERELNRMAEDELSSGGAPYNYVGSGGGNGRGNGGGGSSGDGGGGSSGDGGGGSSGGSVRSEGIYYDTALDNDPLSDDSTDDYILDDEAQNESIARLMAAFEERDSRR
ncbi:MAG: hypothetical protein FWH01_04300 [Oscillospiraceae bacterium]|nr:hypothetical protein [Oscillospiraceae bacterium]